MGRKGTGKVVRELRLSKEDVEAIRSYLGLPRGVVETIGGTMLVRALIEAIKEVVREEEREQG